MRAAQPFRVKTAVVNRGRFARPSGITARQVTGKGEQEPGQARMANQISEGIDRSPFNKRPQPDKQAHQLPSGTKPPQICRRAEIRPANPRRARSASVTCTVWASRRGLKYAIVKQPGTDPGRSIRCLRSPARSCLAQNVAPSEADPQQQPCPEWGFASQSALMVATPNSAAATAATVTNACRPGDQN